MTNSNTPIDIEGAPYSYKESQQPLLKKLSDRVQEMQEAGKLTTEVLEHLQKHFRIQSIYHSNAIEGNALDIGETRQVVEQGLTLTSKPLKDQTEAKNLNKALDFLEELIGESSDPFTETDVKALHQLVLQDIDNGNAGKYRAVPVQTSGSAYAPPGPESVPAQMQEFGSWLADVSVANGNVGLSDAILYAAAAHTWFVSIHPFIDGNGRVARLIMNLVLMRHAFPMAIVRKEDRMRYYDALEESQSSDLSSFVSLVAERLERILEECDEEAEEKIKHQEWTASLAAQFSQGDMDRSKDEYEVWNTAMESLRDYFRQTVELLNESILGGRIYFRDFGTLDFDKYLRLREGESAKRTWFFRVDFLIEGKSARYLFFFGSASWKIQSETNVVVTLHLSREEPSNSFYYERLDNITAPNVPSIVEIGYLPEKEQFISIGKTGRAKSDKVEKLVQAFFEQVRALHFR